MLSFKCGLHGHLRSYDVRRDYFKIDTLKTRRQLTDLICLHKIIHGHLDTTLCFNNIEINIPNSHCLRRHNIFHMNIFKNNIAYFSPLTQMCRLYNKIECAEVDIFNDNLYRFKKKVMALLKNMN